MSKGWKIFFKILYFLVAFGVGVFLVLVVPPAKRDEISYKYLNSYIENKEFVKAVDLISYVYHTNEVAKEEFSNNSGIIIFEGLSTYTETVDEKTTTVMNDAYICIIYNVDRLAFHGNDNKSVLRINGKDIEIVSYDFDGDEKLDSVPSLVSSNYVCYSVNKTEFSKFDSIELIQKDGSTYLKKENIGLTFESDFFTTVSTFVEKYNLGLVDNRFDETENKELYDEYNKIHTLNNNYQLVDSFKTSEKVKDEAGSETFWFLFVFLIWVIILGDCLVGKRYIFQFIKFLYKKIKEKIKPKTAQRNEAISNNFYSLVTFKANICEGFDKDIIISYQCLDDKQYSFKVIIGKNNEYMIKQRIHGGKYKLINVECSDYEVLNLPEEIEIKGYTVLIEFNIQNKK